MPEPLRILLRLAGLVMFVGGIAFLVLLVAPGPSEVADWMGDECAHGRNETGEQCTITDVIELALAAPVLILIGFVLAIALRPPGKGPLTLDFSRGRGQAP